MTAWGHCCRLQSSIFRHILMLRMLQGKSEIESKLKNIIESALVDMARISHNISPHILENYGLTLALENFISDINISENIKFDVHFERFGRFELKEELTIYRTISELIHNTIKHAKATLIVIHINVLENMLTITYEDNGIGFPVEAENVGKTRNGHEKYKK